MGASASQGRRALIDKVGECITANNSLAGKVGEVVDANNKLAKQTSEDVARLKGRCDSLNAWCKQTEKNANLAHDRLETQHRDITFLLYGLSRMDKLRWFVFGTLPPLPSRNPMVSKAVTAADLEREFRAHKTVLEADAQKAMSQTKPGPLPNVMPHTSLGPRVLP